jgi:LPS O-antigen subunit length determinant protein (WzzB/FepE family)
MDDKRSQTYAELDPRDDDDDELDLADLWHTLVEYRKLIGIITAASTAIAAILAFTMTPVYRAETLLSPVDNSDKANSLLQFGGLESFVGINVGDVGGASTEALAALTSRIFTDAFIREEGLMPVLYADEWDAGQKAWKDAVEAPTAWDAYDLFDRKIRFVNKDVKTGLYTLAIEWSDPALAARWANRLVQRINAERRAEAIRESETNIAYLKDQLAGTSLVEMQQAIYQLIEAKIKKIMVAKSQDEYAFKVIDPAVPPQERVRPKRLAILVLGFLCGLLISMFAVLIRVRVRRYTGH